MSRNDDIAGTGMNDRTRVASPARVQRFEEMVGEQDNRDVVLLAAGERGIDQQFGLLVRRPPG